MWAEGMGWLRAETQGGGRGGRHSCSVCSRWLGPQHMRPGHAAPLSHRISGSFSCVLLASLYAAVLVAWLMLRVTSNQCSMHGTHEALEYLLVSDGKL